MDITTTRLYQDPVDGRLVGIIAGGITAYFDGQHPEAQVTSTDTETNYAVSTASPDSSVKASIDMRTYADEATGETSSVLALTSGTTGGDSITFKFSANPIQGARIMTDSPLGLIVQAVLIKLMGLPTTDPKVAGALWNSTGTLKISAG